VTFLSITRGDGPLVLSMPHGGRTIPPEYAAHMTAAARGVPDTDWWIERLYDFGPSLGASAVCTDISRYVIDVNRDPSGQSLYPGRTNTALCPLETFDGEPLYRPGAEPGADDIAARKQTYFEPYHQALREALDRARAGHGYALLYDCHSIRSVIPRLFPGRLPVFNIGVNGGKSCAAPLVRAVGAACGGDREHDFVVDGRFTGGWITRHYGDPASGVHALQMELAQRAYMMETPPWTYDEAKAERLRNTLRRALAEYVAAAAQTREAVR
jgi:N-formylglutamate deformylase